MLKGMAVFSLTLIRHGETGANKHHVIQGQLDVPLSEDGHRQASLIGNRLQHQHYTHIFASDLSRAKQTVDSIVNQNLHGKNAVIPDQRLRERKFGEVEGKSISELKRLARLANQPVPNFTPSGAETAQQVRHRAVLFFQELCQQLLKTSAKASSSSISATSSSSSSSNNNINNNPSPSSAASVVASQPGDSCSSISPQTVVVPTGGLKRRRNSSVCVEDGGGGNGGVVGGDNAGHDDGPRFHHHQHHHHHEFRSSSVGATPLELCKARPLHLLTGPIGGDETANSAQLCVYVPSPRHRQHQRHHRSTNHENGRRAATITTSAAATGAAVSPEIIVGPPPGASPIARSHHHRCHPQIVTAAVVAAAAAASETDCPNVSLSPSIEQRMSRISSSDSDRRPSVDGSAGCGGVGYQHDDDAVPCLTADVLVVSHGGWMRELVRHFVEDLGCTLPGGRGQALRLSPNTGLSKFTVSVSDDAGEPPKVVCLVIHDKDHLTENGVDTVNTSAL